MLLNVAMHKKNSGAQGVSSEEKQFKNWTYDLYFKVDVWSNKRMNWIENELIVQKEELDSAQFFNEYGSKEL